MTSSVLVLALTVGAAALALWTYLRLNALAPAGVGACLLHVCASLALVHVVSSALIPPIIGDGTSMSHTLAALFALFLPALAYTFLSAIWAFAEFGRALRLR